MPKTTLLLAVAALTAACSTTPATTVATTPASHPVTTPASPHRLGTTQTNASPSATVTVTAFAYRALRSPYPPQRKGYVWAGVNAKTCITTNSTGKKIPVTFYPWSLQFADDTKIGPATQWSEDQFTVPIFTSRALDAGGCLRGWVVFEVPAGKRPTRVVYAPAGNTPTEWAV